VQSQHIRLLRMMLTWSFQRYNCWGHWLYNLLHRLEHMYQHVEV
jgi:hypothetical protein